jgi:hypothetical protein
VSLFVRVSIGLSTAWYASQPDNKGRDALDGQAQAVEKETNSVVDLNRLLEHGPLGFARCLKCMMQTTNEHMYQDIKTWQQPNLVDALKGQVGVGVELRLGQDIICKRVYVSRVVCLFSGGQTTILEKGGASTADKVELPLG